MFNDCGQWFLTPWALSWCTSGCGWVWRGWWEWSNPESCHTIRQNTCNQLPMWKPLETGCIWILVCLVLEGGDFKPESVDRHSDVSLQGERVHGSRIDSLERRQLFFVFVHQISESGFMTNSGVYNTKLVVCLCEEDTTTHLYMSVPRSRAFILPHSPSWKAALKSTNYKLVRCTFESIQFGGDEKVSYMCAIDRPINVRFRALSNFCNDLQQYSKLSDVHEF